MIAALPTIADLRDCLSDLIEEGFADHDVQIVIVTDATLQAIAVAAPDAARGDRPALMAEFNGKNGRLPVCFISKERVEALKPSASTHRPRPETEADILREALETIMRRIPIEGHRIARSALAKAAELRAAR